MRNFARRFLLENYAGFDSPAANEPRGTFAHDSAPHSRSRHVRVDIHLGYPFFHDRIRKYFCRFFYGNASEVYIGTIRIYSCASVNELCPIQLRRSAATAASRAVDAMDCNV